jgi:sulfite reductase (ferredoxin)
MSNENPTPVSPGDTQPKRSPVELIKESSRQLRGTLAEELAQPVDHFSEANKQLLKFHGSYQQEDRDARKNRAKAGVGKHYMFMIRGKIPGGRLTPEQYLAMDELAGRYANGTVRLTTRQSIQLHGILKDNLKATIAGINACLLSTLGACGDVNRNVMCCPAPYSDPVRQKLRELTDAIAAHLAPHSKAYADIWVNGVRESRPEEEDFEPIYGKVYLPRKFKTGLALPEDNCIDIHAQDLGLLGVVRDGELKGFNVLVGGGMGMTHGNANTFPHLGQPICFVPVEHTVGAAEAVVKLFRDHGNRADRKRARIKYVVHDWGVEKFRGVLATYLPCPAAPPEPVAVGGFDLHLGWHPQGDGRWFFGVSVENGRIKDDGTLRMRSGLRRIVDEVRPLVRITPQQDLLLCDVASAERVRVERLMKEYGIPHPEALSPVQKFSMSCPAIPTCGLAISESERALPGIIDELERELATLGLEREPITVRMTGCPNGCARPYQAEVGIVGRSGDRYALFVGGHRLGTRLSFPLKDLVPRDQIVPVLRSLLEDYREARTPGEGFGDYCQRLGPERVRAMVGAPATPAGH